MGPLDQIAAILDRRIDRRAAIEPAARRNREQSPRDFGKDLGTALDDARIERLGRRAIQACPTGGRRHCRFGARQAVAADGIAILLGRRLNDLAVIVELNTVDAPRIRRG